MKTRAETCLTLVPTNLCVSWEIFENFKFLFWTAPKTSYNFVKKNSFSGFFCHRKSKMSAFVPSTQTCPGNCPFVPLTCLHRACPHLCAHWFAWRHVHNKRVCSLFVITIFFILWFLWLLHPSPPVRETVLRKTVLYHLFQQTCPPPSYVFHRSAQRKEGLQALGVLVLNLGHPFFFDNCGQPQTSGGNEFYKLEGTSLGPASTFFCSQLGSGTPGGRGSSGSEVFAVQWSQAPPLGVRPFPGLLGDGFGVIFVVFCLPWWICVPRNLF